MLHGIHNYWSGLHIIRNILAHQQFVSNCFCTSRAHIPKSPIDFYTILLVVVVAVANSEHCWQSLCHSLQQTKKLVQQHVNKKHIV